jgi:hypothetical protein
MEQRLLATIRASQAELRSGGSQRDAFLELVILRFTIRLGIIMALAIWIFLIIMKPK